MNGSSRVQGGPLVLKRYTCDEYNKLILYDDDRQKICAGDDHTL